MSFVELSGENSFNFNQVSFLIVFRKSSLHHQGCRLTCWRLTCSPGKTRGIFGPGRSSLRYNLPLCVQSFCLELCYVQMVSGPRDDSWSPWAANSCWEKWHFLVQVFVICIINSLRFRWQYLYVLQNIMCILKPFYTHTGVFAHVAISNIFLQYALMCIFICIIRSFLFKFEYLHYLQYVMCILNHFILIWVFLHMLQFLTYSPICFDVHLHMDHDIILIQIRLFTLVAGCHVHFQITFT